MNYDWKMLHAPLLEWYQNGHRDLPFRKTKNPYHIWISEIMLQQTRVEAVKEYYLRFIKNLPDIESLSAVPEERLLKLWEGLGYYNRARNLKRAAVCVMEEHGGQFPVEYEQVLALSGIGAYTAGAICSICYDAPTPAVDGNVLRVMTRLADWHAVIDREKTKREAAEFLRPLYEMGDCGLLTQSLMELGAVVCIPNGAPKCMECPARTLCKAHARGTISMLPVREKKRARAVCEKTVFVLHDGDSYGICKRPETGLLANMWQFYNIDGRLSPADAVAHVSELGFHPVRIEKEIPYTHIFSHVEWRMTAYYISCTNHKDDLHWVSREELASDYALPTAFKFFMEKEFSDDLS